MDVAKPFRPHRLVVSLLLSGLSLLPWLIGSGAPVAAQWPATVVLSPVKDNTLYEHPSGALSSGLGQHVFVGRSNLSFRRRALIAFDVAGAVPAGATVVSATLGLNMSRTHAGPQSISLHRMLADWGEGASDAERNEGAGAAAAPGDATWLQPFFGRDGEWRTHGGDFADAASATLSVGPPGWYAWPSTPETVADVQLWLDAPDSSFGWLLHGTETTNQTTKRFDSKDHGEVQKRPKLVIAYVPELSEAYLPLAVRLAGPLTERPTVSPTPQPTASPGASLTASPTPLATVPPAASPTPQPTEPPTS